MTPFSRRLTFLTLLALALATPASTVTLGKPVALLWDYTIALGSGVVATSFIVQGCTAAPDCFAGCTPIDLYTVSPASVAADIAYTDVNVLPGSSYRYQIVTVGTVAGVATRSSASNQACIYVVAQKRGSPTPIAP